MAHRIQILLLAVSILFMDCRKSGSSSGTGSMAATAGSSTFTSSDCYVTTDGRNFTFWGLSGKTLNQPYILFNIYTFTGSLTPGPYNIDGVQISASYNTDSTTFNYARHGTITISSVTVNQKVTGSFDFTCTDSTKVAGSFTAIFR